MYTCRFQCSIVRLDDEDGTFRQLDNVVSELDAKSHASLNLFGRYFLQPFLLRSGMPREAGYRDYP